MIRKEKLFGKEGYLYLGPQKKGFFVNRVTGKMPNGAGYDKINISEVYESKGRINIAMKKMIPVEKSSGKVYASTSIKTDFISELTQALTMLATEISGIPAQVPTERDVERSRDEVQDFLDSHGGKMIV